MNEADKKMMDILMEDKGKKYLIIVDNDDVSVIDTEKEETIYHFVDFSDLLLIAMFEYLGLRAEGC